jgi:tungstate transport system ATP-binding protein
LKPILELENISKTFEQTAALHQVSLQIVEGEVFSLLGPNGSGKTTLLRIMAGIETPTAGEMRFNGERVVKGRLAKVRLQATMVFQKTTMFNTSVYKNVAYGLRLRGHSKQDLNNRIKQALETVRLDGFERRSARKLSGGEQQRVALARALALDTKALLLDEPTANIDPRNASIVEESLSRVNKEKGTTIVVATHNMFQAETLAERAALLLGGKIVKVGTPDEIFALPSTLMASYARLSNVFSGVAKTTGEGTSLVDAGDGVVVEAAFEAAGSVTVFVRPEDILLSLNPIVSSARNSFEGRVTEISDLGSIVRLQIKAGKEFRVQITKRSFAEMRLNIGSRVFLAFKASSIHAI